jgi:hypothetical protein
MLTNQRIKAFVSTTQPDKARELYGITFERYNFIEQDDSGIWTSPGGTRVAWFKDPDGNILSVSD